MRLECLKSFSIILISPVLVVLEIRVFVNSRSSALKVPKGITPVPDSTSNEALFTCSLKLYALSHKGRVMPPTVKRVTEFAGRSELVEVVSVIMSDNCESTAVERTRRRGHRVAGAGQYSLLKFGREFNQKSPWRLVQHRRLHSKLNDSNFAESQF